MNQSDASPKPPLEVLATCMAGGEKNPPVFAHLHSVLKKQHFKDQMATQGTELEKIINV